MFTVLYLRNWRPYLRRYDCLFWKRHLQMSFSSIKQFLLQISATRIRIRIEVAPSFPVTLPLNERWSSPSNSSVSVLMVNSMRSWRAECCCLLLCFPPTEFFTWPHTQRTIFLFFSKVLLSVVNLDPCCFWASRIRIRILQSSSKKK